MRVEFRYSHLNGEEYLKVHKPELLVEVETAIAEVDAESCRTKVSKEEDRLGDVLYSPDDMNSALKAGFEKYEWTQRRHTFYVTSDERLLRRVYQLSSDKQREAINAAGYEPILSYNQTDFVKDRVAVEAQFGKYSFVAHDLFVKHLSFYVSDIIDVGIEILPTKELQREMSSGPSYYEKDLLNVIRQGRGVPAVPLIMLGIAP